MCPQDLVPQNLCSHPLSLQSMVLATAAPDPWPPKAPGPDGTKRTRSGGEASIDTRNASAFLAPSGSANRGGGTEGQCVRGSQTSCQHSTVAASWILALQEGSPREGQSQRPRCHASPPAAWGAVTGAQWTECLLMVSGKFSTHSEAEERKVFTQGMLQPQHSHGHSHALAGHTAAVSAVARGRPEMKAEVTAVTGRCHSCCAWRVSPRSSAQTRASALV